VGVAKVVSSFQKRGGLCAQALNHIPTSYMGKYNISDEGSRGAEEPHDPTVAQIVISPFVRQLSRPSDPAMRTDPKVLERRTSVSWRASMSLKACAQKKPHT